MDQTERIGKLEQRVSGHDTVLETHGGTLDHIVNTMDNILLPTQKVHSDKIYHLGEEIKERDQKLQVIHDYITGQKGAWSFIQKAGIVIAAGCSVIMVVLKLMGK